MDVLAVTDWLWRLHTPLVQAYAVRERDGFNLIDTATAGGEEAILAALEQIGGGPPQVHEILLTHAHDDHTGSAAALVERTGARVLAPAADAPAIEGSEAVPPPQLLDWERPLYAQTKPHVPPAPPVRVDVRLADGDVLEWQRPARVVAAPGHTPGSVALYFEPERVLVAGDAIASHEGRPMLGVFNADPARAQDSYARLAALGTDIACFGHGEPAPI